MEVILRSTKHRVKKPVIRDHYWYDPETKQRLHGRGGKMIFVYDKMNQKSVPRIVDAEEWVYEDSYDDIEKWINETGVQVIEKAPGHFVTIDINTGEWSDIESDLYRHKIAYDYDEKQLQQQSLDKKEKKTWQNSPSKWQIRPPH